jgi:hypothetical protein
MVVVANYTFESSFTNCLLHLEEEKVFGSTKRFTNCLPSVNNDSHRLDRVNFFHPKVSVLTTKPNIVEDVCMHKPPFSSNNLLPLVFQGGLQLMANGVLNTTHPILQFNVLHFKKPQGSNAKQG